MLQRSPDSHKGQNGRVCIIGGSTHFHGAPIFAGLSAEKSGADLIFPIVPNCHSEVTKQASYNFICHYFKLNHLTRIDLPQIKKVLAKSDVAVIGPGLGTKNTTLNALSELMRGIEVPMIIDASALQIIPKLLEENDLLPPNTILTPHHGEFAAMTGKEIPPNLKQQKELVQKYAEKLEAIILLKGPTDILANSENCLEINKAGNAGLTVGGTGDALAGLIGSLISQRIDPFQACQKSIKIIGQAGENLFKEKGYSYTTLDLIHEIPKLVY